MALELNTRFGDYYLLRKIAVGGMAEVYLAVKHGPGLFDRLVALKTILRERSDRQTYIQMFYNEARIGARFNHPNLVNVFDVKVVDGTLTMIQEYVPGATVADLVVRANKENVELTRAAGIRIALDASLGLHHAHHLKDIDGSPLQIVHRDVSPQNILVGYRGEVKVFDFGVAAMSSSNGDQENLAGVLAGKYAYMSPEQCHGGELDERSDVFSLGILLYELTTQKRLFRRKNQIEVLRAITEDEIKPPSSEVTGYPRGLEQVVMAALERDPKDRPESALAFHEALLKYAALADDQLSQDALAGVMSRIFEREIQEEHRLVKDGLVRLREQIQKESSEGKFPAEGDASSKGAAEESERREDSLELQALAAKSAPKVGVDSIGADESVNESWDSSLSDDLKRARRLNIGLALVLVLLLAGVAAVVVMGLLPLSAGDSVASTPAETPRVLVRTEPAGATIFVDDVQRAEATPASIDAPLDQPVGVRVELAGHQSASMEVTLTEGAPVQTAYFALRPELVLPGEGGAVRVVTVPADAIVAIDDVVRGQGTPLLVEDLELGVEHTLRAEREGYETRLISFELMSRATREIVLELQETVDLGMLSVFSDPPGADVFLDGERVGTTPLELIPLVSGRLFQVELRLEGYRPSRTDVTLETNQQLTLEERLQRPRRDRGDRPEEEASDEPSPDIAPIESDEGADDGEDESPYELLR